MSVFWFRRRARKPYHCRWGCLAMIEPGAVYSQAWITPRDPEFGAGGWSTRRYHGSSWKDCPVPPPLEYRIQADRIGRSR